MAPRGRSAQPTDLPDPDDLEQLPPKPTGSLTFRQPETELEGPSLSPSDPADDSPSAAEPNESWPDPSDAPRTSSRTSSGETPAKLRDLIVQGFRALVMAGGAAAHQQLARSETAKILEMWTTDTDDAEAIGDPLAGITNRRLGDVVNASGPDAEDLIGALIGIATYGMKQYNKWQAGRAMRRTAAAAAIAEARSAEPAGDRPAGDQAPAYGAANG